MGVSFKVSKTGSRFRPKPSLHSETFIEDVSETSKQSSQPRKQEGEEVSGVASIAEGHGIDKEHEVSFTLNLYPDGYSIGKPSEKDTVHQGNLQDVPKSLHPYDRASETLFSAIESGRLPGDILENIPCKYVDGTLVCEVRDYRKCGSEQGSTAPAIDGSPVITKVCLRMSLENVVKDIPLISDNSWSYGDLMEVESRILKALQPQLCLDPCPKLDRLSTNPVPTKLDLALGSLRRKRLRQMPEVTVTSNNKIYGKKVCIDRVAESSHGRLEESGIVTGNLMPQHGNENLTAQSIVQNSMLALRPKSFVPDASVPSVPLVSQQSRYQMGVGMPRSMQDHGPGSVVNPSGSSTGGPELVSYAENLNSTASFHPKRENQDGPLSPLASFNKRSRLTPMGSDGFQPQQMGPSMDSLQGGDMNWKNTFLQQQALARGVQYQNTSIQKYPQQAFDGILKQEPVTVPFAAGQPALRFVPKEEPVDMDRVDGPEFNRGRSDMQMVGTDASHLEVQQQRIQQRLPQHSFMRSAFPQTWNNIGQHIEKDSRKEEQFQKRKSAQSPRLSAGALPQSPLSSKSGEFSSGSVGPHFGAVATSAALASAQKEKSAVTSVPAIGGTQSLTSSANDSMQRHHQAQVAAKRRSNSLPRTPAMSGVGSPASVTNMSVPLNANSPSVGTPPLADQTMLERFSKIDMVATRYHLNSRKNKVDNYPGRKRNVYSPHDLSVCLSNVSNNEDFKDDAKPLSKSLIGGSMNTCKIRLLNFAHQERMVQGNVVSIVHHLQRMVMLQKSSDGTVAFYFGDAEDFDILAAEENLPTLPNSHSADLLAAQFCKLMIREGYPPVEENLQLKPTCTNIASSSAANTAGIAPNNPGAEMQQYADAVSGQATSIDVKPNVGSASLNSSQNLLGNARMLPPGNPQAVQMSQGLLSGVSMPARPQQLDPQPSLQSQQQLQQSQQQQQPQNQHSLIQQQQQQQQQFQRSPMMLGPNSLSHLSAMGQNSNMHLGNHMVNKASSLQLQMLQPQQQQQQQQQTQMQRKMMMGLGTGMGNMGNNMVGLGGLGNPMGMGGARGIGGTGMSTPLAPISSMGMGNVGQNPISISNVISQQLRSGKFTASQAQFMAAKLKRPMMGASQSGLAGISGGRQMMPGTAGLSSMLGQNLNRPNMSPMQRTAMASMGPPKVMNIYMNQQQQHMQLQQQQHQQLQQQLQQQQIQHQQQQLQPPPQQPQQLQQQETTSPLQAVVSPSQVGSPSMGIAQLNQQPQQQLSPQQLSQRTPMSPQISSGAIHGLSAGNPETCPASPQLSSQTLGSVGSITNSPMELQGVNKSNSVGNN